QLLEPLGLVGLEATVLVAPAVQRLLADAEALADLGDGQALGQVGLGLAEFGDDLLRRVSLHRSSPHPHGVSVTLIAHGPVFGEQTTWVQFSHVGTRLPLLGYSEKLPPFALWSVFPTSDYYGGSDAPEVSLPDCWGHLFHGSLPRSRKRTLREGLL